MKTIHHVFDTTAPRDTVFAALTTTQGLSGWWTTIVKAEAADASDPEGGYSSIETPLVCDPVRG